MKLGEVLSKKKMRAIDLASIMGVSLPIVRKWVTGKSSPRLIHALMIKRYFGKAIKLEDLLKPQDITRYNRG